MAKLKAVFISLILDFYINEGTHYIKRHQHYFDLTLNFAEFSWISDSWIYCHTNQCSADRLDSRIIDWAMYHQSWGEL